MTDSSDVPYMSDETSSSLPAPKPLSQLRQSLHTIIGVMDNEDKDKSKSDNATLSVIFEASASTVYPPNRDECPTPSISGIKSAAKTVEHNHKKTAHVISHTHPQHEADEEFGLNDSYQEESESVSSPSQNININNKRYQQEGSKQTKNEGETHNQTPSPHPQPVHRCVTKLPRAKQNIKNSQAVSLTPRNNLSTNEYVQFSNDESTTGSEKLCNDDIEQQDSLTYKYPPEQEVKHSKTTKPLVHKQEVPYDLHEENIRPMWSAQSYPFHADFSLPYPQYAPWVSGSVHRYPVQAEDVENTKKSKDNGILPSFNKGSLKEQFVRFLSSLSKRPSFTKRVHYNDQVPLAQNMKSDAPDEKTSYGSQEFPSDQYIFPPAPSSHPNGRNFYPKHTAPFPMVHLNPSATHMRQPMSSSHSWHTTGVQRQDVPDLSQAQHTTSQQCPMAHGIYTSQPYYLPPQYAHGYSFSYANPNHMKTGQYMQKTTESQSRHSFHQYSNPALAFTMHPNSSRPNKNMNVASEYRNPQVYACTLRKKKKEKEVDKTDNPNAKEEKGTLEKEEPEDSEPISNTSQRGIGDEKGDQENEDNNTQKERSQKKSWIPLRMENLNPCDPPRDKVEVYYFDHGNAGYYRTTDHRPPIVTENFIEQTDYYITKFWAEIFGSLHIGFAFLITFLLQLYRFFLYSLLRPISIGFIQLTSDYLIKPFLSIIFNGIIQPFFILLFNVATSIRDLCEPLAHAIGFFLHEIADLFNAIRLVEANDVTYVVPSRRPSQRQVADWASYERGDLEESKEGTPPNEHE